MTVYTGKKITGAKCPKCGMGKHSPDQFCNTKPQKGKA